MKVRAAVRRGRRIVWTSSVIALHVVRPNDQPSGGSGAGGKTVPVGSGGTQVTVPNPNRGSVLSAGETLQPGWFLLSPNHQYELVMQASDGNLVLYQGGHALWSSGAQGAGAYAVMQSDGNFVIYNGGAARWWSNTSGFAGAQLVLQDDSNLVAYHAGHPVWDWGSGYLGNQLIGWTLRPGAYLLSPNHQYELVMQASDGNLVLYQGGHALWSSGGTGAGASVTMQSDGNLVIYNGGAARWNSSTAGFPGSSLVLQDDNNLVIYQGSNAIWDWGSGRLISGGGSSNQGQAIVNQASKWGGTQYCWYGGDRNGPTRGTPDPYDHYFQCAAGTAGFDCTGLTLYAVYQATGGAVLLSHGPGQANSAPGQAVSEANLQPGDIVYFGSSLNDAAGHAGVYAGVINGQPSFWSAVTEGIGVTLKSMAWEEHAKPFAGARRFWH